MATKNLLFITADQWRGECLSALEHPTVKTPNLDALAADGVIFRKHYAQCTLCGPSRASLYCSRQLTLIRLSMYPLSYEHRMGTYKCSVAVWWTLLPKT